VSDWTRSDFSGAASKLEKLSIRSQGMPDGKRRALLAKARRELLGPRPSKDTPQPQVKP
jgi:hypothetical protein